MRNVVRVVPDGGSENDRGKRQSAGNAALIAILFLGRTGLERVRIDHARRARQFGVLRQVYGVQGIDHRLFGG